MSKVLIEKHRSPNLTFVEKAKKISQWIFALLIICISIVPLRAQKNVIFDSDMGPDCDDAGALAMLHAMADNGEVNILAIGACISDPFSAPSIDAINTYYGRPDIPIGTLKEEGFLDWRHDWIIAVKDFPNDLKSGDNAPDVIDVYRKTLAAQPDNSVTLIAVGPLRNIKNLLQSGPDSHSELNGLELVAKKVKSFTLMGGRFFDGGTEFNLEQDGIASEYVINNFPENIEVVLSEFDIGSSIATGARVSTQTPVTNPVRKAYEVYSGSGKNNASWDQTAVLYAIRGVGEYWELLTEGHVYIDKTGYTDWKESPDKNQSLIMWKNSVWAEDPLEIIIEDLMIQPPRRLTTVSTGALKDIQSISFYPNPSKNEIFLEGNIPPNSTYEINSIEGKSLLSGVISGAGISLSDVKAGMYILKIKTEAGENVQRFVKE